jgi:AcrR family transcriptional regulator
MVIMLSQTANAKPPARGPVELPDPFRPANLYRYSPALGSAVSKRWVNHQERRSNILAAARRLMVDSGFDGVSFRDIADACEISVPTIYNIVGDRAEVLNQAAVEWVQWLSVAVLQDDGGNKVLRLLQGFWDSSLDYPDYTKTAAQVQAMPERPLNAAFHKTGTGFIAKWLNELRAQQRLRASIDVTSLANQLALSATAGICSWALNPYDTTRYRRDFANGPGLMLLGAVSGQEIAVVEQALDAILA